MDRERRHRRRRRIAIAERAGGGGEEAHHAAGYDRHAPARRQRDRRQGGRGECAAERNAGLAHAHREPAVLAREPAHHGLAAGRRRKGTAESGEEQDEKRGVKSGGAEHGHTADADHDVAADQRAAFALDVDDPAGHEHREQRADHDGGIEQPDLGARQAQVFLQERRERRYALHDDRYRYLGRQRQAQHAPVEGHHAEQAPALRCRHAVATPGGANRGRISPARRAAWEVCRDACCCR